MIICIWYFYSNPKNVQQSLIAEICQKQHGFLWNHSVIKHGQWGLSMTKYHITSAILEHELRSPIRTLAIFFGLGVGKWVLAKLNNTLHCMLNMATHVCSQLCNYLATGTSFPKRGTPYIQTYGGEYCVAPQLKTTYLVLLKINIGTI